MKRMSRSKYVEQRTDYYRSRGCQSIQSEISAEADAKVLDDFGITWEREVEPWPEEVHFDVLCPAGKSWSCRYAGWGSPLREVAARSEAKRRWRGYGVAVGTLKRIALAYAHNSIGRSYAAEALRELGEEVPE